MAFCIVKRWEMGVVILNSAIGLAFLCLSAYVMVGALDLEYYTALGPGPGFFPFWLGATMAVLTTAWLVRVLAGRRTPSPEDLIPSRRGRLRILSVLGVLVFYQLFSEVLGFRLTMLAVLFFVLHVSERQPLFLAAVIALAGSFGAYHLFHDLLGVYLPFATIPLLEDLGL